MLHVWRLRGSRLLDVLTTGLVPIGRKRVQCGQRTIDPRPLECDTWCCWRLAWPKRRAGRADNSPRHIDVVGRARKYIQRD